MPPLPPTTKALMLCCVVVFCVTTFVPVLNQWFGLWPLATGRFYPWQVLSYGFLHNNIAHLAFNMLGLWMFGAELERVWGQKRYLQFLGVCLVVAALSQLLVTGLMRSPAYAVGASGALFGLLLAYAMVFPRRQFDAIGFIPMVLMMIPSSIFYVIGIMLFAVMMTNRSALPIPPVPVPAMATVIAFGAIELVLGVLGQSGIAHFAHLGGMLGAFLMLRYWSGRPPFGRRR
jgi:membrane associated rhomboid family serine protease